MPVSLNLCHVSVLHSLLFPSLRALLKFHKTQKKLLLFLDKREHNLLKMNMYLIYIFPLFKSFYIENVNWIWRVCVCVCVCMCVCVCVFVLPRALSSYLAANRDLYIIISILNYFLKVKFFYNLSQFNRLYSWIWFLINKFR